MPKRLVHGISHSLRVCARGQACVLKTWTGLTSAAIFSEAETSGFSSAPQGPRRPRSCPASPLAGLPCAHALVPLCYMAGSDGLSHFIQGLKIAREALFTRGRDPLVARPLTFSFVLCMQACSCSRLGGEVDSFAFVRCAEHAAPEERHLQVRARSCRSRGVRCPCVVPRCYA